MQNSRVGTLPADLFHLLSAELSARLDFATLFNCVVSSKYIANSGAITALYRYGTPQLVSVTIADIVQHFSRQPN